MHALRFTEFFLGKDPQLFSVSAIISILRQYLPLNSSKNILLHHLYCYQSRGLPLFCDGEGHPHKYFLRGRLIPQLSYVPIREGVWLLNS